LVSVRTSNVGATTPAAAARRRSSSSRRKSSIPIGHRHWRAVKHVGLGRRRPEAATRTPDGMWTGC
jgi:hypothetical protein